MPYIGPTVEEERSAKQHKEEERRLTNGLAIVLLVSVCIVALVLLALFKLTA